MLPCVTRPALVSNDAPRTRALRAFAFHVRSFALRSFALRVAQTSLVCGLAVGAFAAQPVKADAPPDDGRRYVRYSVQIASLDSLPSTHRLVLYPIDLSNGAPQPEYRVVNEGDEIALGRRSGLVGFFAVPAAEVEGSVLRGLPTNASEEVLETYFASARVAKATLEARPVGTVDEASLVRVVTHGFAVEALGPSGLVVRHTETTYTYEDGERETVGPDAAPSRAPSLWESPLTWVALAVASNALVAFVVLVFVRRKRDPVAPPS